MAEAEGSVRVHPWVSYALVATLLLGSLGILLTSPDARQRAEESPEVQAAVRDFERNPMVTVTPQFARLVGESYIAELREKHERKRELGGVAVLSERMRIKTQSRFDEAQRKAFESLRDLPSWRFGIVDGESPLSTTFGHLVVNEKAIGIAVSVIIIGLAAISLEGAWGSLLFGALCLLLPMVTRLTYASLYGDLGAPWTGASGLAAGLLGAYLVRSFRGFTIPVWLLLPVWIVAEYLLARDLPIDHFDATPVVVHGACFVFGALAAGVIWLTDLEDTLKDRKLETAELMSNPVLEEALQQHEAGQVEAAFDLLDVELRRDPSNHDVALGLWQVVSGTDLVQRAMPTLLGSVRDSLRAGRREEACSLWLALSAEVEVQAEGTLLVRMGEALLDQEEHEAALQAFGLAVGGRKPLSSVLAMRVVRGTRDLDSELAGRAASVALIDDQLSGSDRAALQAVLETAEARAASAPASGTDSLGGIESAPAAPAAPVAAPAPEPDPLQDPHAIAVDDFQELAEGESLSGDPDAWNQPGLVEDLSSELEDEEGSFDWSGLQDDGPDEADANADSGARDSSETTETLEPGEKDSASGPVAPVPDPLAAENVEDAPMSSPRSLRARAGVPVSLDEEGIHVEIDGGSKTRIPFERIDAVAAGAVRGLAEKPVLVVDLVLNWLDVPDQPLKVVRLRSDRFDPRAVMAGRESALDALRALLDRVIASSGATPLPGRDSALGNPFASFPDLASYDRDVLMAE